MKVEARVIIAGGRDYEFVEEDVEFLDKLFNSLYKKVCDITVVSGGARGADAWGEAYAKQRDWPVAIFKADWDKYGKAAGGKRNAEMAAYCTYRAKETISVLVAFPGGAGTRNMVITAGIYGFDMVVEKRDGKFDVTRGPRSH